MKYGGLKYWLFLYRHSLGKESTVLFVRAQPATEAIEATLVNGRPPNQKKKTKHFTRLINERMNGTSHCGRTFFLFGLLAHFYGTVDGCVFQ